MSSTSITSTSSSTSTTSISSRSSPMSNSPKCKRPKQSELMEIYKELSLIERLDICEHWQNLPAVIMTEWEESYKHLDFDELYRELSSDDLNYFLLTMQRIFISVSVKSEQLQDLVNILENREVVEFPNVLDCEITWDNNSKDTSSQGALLDLPKLLTGLNHLQIYMPVEVGSLGHFAQLENLTLYENVSRKALTSIWTGCKCLKRLRLFGCGRPNTIGISQSPELSELSLPVISFNPSSAFEILQMPQLQSIELLQNDALFEETIDAISLVIRQRALDIDSLYINSYSMDNPKWLPNLELYRCIHMTNITFVNCLFLDMDPMIHRTLPVLHQATFYQCFDLKDSQVVNFVKACPQLTQLHLVYCIQLTKKCLYDLCELRCSYKAETPPLQLNLGESEDLKEEFNLHFKLQSALELVETPPEEYSDVQHVLFEFLSPVSEQ